jgi:hypothetical protein
MPARDTKQHYQRYTLSAPCCTTPYPSRDKLNKPMHGALTAIVVPLLLAMAIAREHEVRLHRVHRHMHSGAPPVRATTAVGTSWVAVHLQWQQQCSAC